MGAGGAQRQPERARRDLPLRRALRVDEHYGLGDAADAANADADARAHAADELASALVRLALRAAPSTEQGTEALLALALGALPESVADDVDDVEVLDIGVAVKSEAELNSWFMWCYHYRNFAAVMSNMQK